MFPRSGGVGEILVYEFAEDLLLMACRCVLYKYNISSLRPLERSPYVSSAVDWQWNYGRNLSRLHMSAYCLVVNGGSSGRLTLMMTT